MKKLLAILLSFALILSFAACAPVDSADTTPEGTTDPDAYRKERVVSLRQDLEAQEVRATNWSVYLPEDTSDGSIFLTADIQNNSSSAISNVVVYFAAWDADNQPIILKTHAHPTEGAFYHNVGYGDIQIAAGETWVADDGENISGLRMDASMTDIVTTYAIVASYTTEDGTEWTNPHLTGWQVVYSGYELESWMVMEGANVHEVDPNAELKASLAQMQDARQTQSVVALNGNIHSAEEMEDNYAMIYTDIQNNSASAISNICLAFAAWDAQGEPIMIKSASGATADSYIKEVDATDVTIEAGQFWAADSGDSTTGLRIDQSQTNIATVMAIVVSYTEADGTVWEDPYYDTWKQIYEGNALEDWMVPAA